MRHTKQDLMLMQALPFETKVRMTRERARAWYDTWVLFEIFDTATGKVRAVTWDTSERDEPPLLDTEYIRAAFPGWVYPSFSGGKDSTVLWHILKKLGLDLPAVFSDTGLEFPEVRRFATALADVVVRPELRFDQVVKQYGCPVISKEISEGVRKARNGIKKGTYSLRLRQFGVGREEYGGLEDSGKFDYEKTVERSKFTKEKYRPLLDVNFKMSEQCCNVMKKKPFAAYERETGRKPITAQLAAESMNRETAWRKNGCNAFDAKRPISNPMAFWTEQDVLQYMNEYHDEMLADIKEALTAAGYPDLAAKQEHPWAAVYGELIPDGKQTVTDINDNERPKLKTTGCDRTGCIFCAFGAHVEKAPRFERLKETHPRQWRYCIGGGEHSPEDGAWQPSKDGLGLGHVFDELNEIYGADFIKYGKEQEEAP